ncbi:hypothetical protein GGH94_001667 [Coemansia aciculifera]|uniref:DnaJ homolog subfamily C member 2 n=1 Tax=Coemansia aciculifera TaxID=417176 RepID=A0A9W8M4S5_9FUNG|nr:hypothetical protein GGH94_001667 [Coemansia aciculifera]
MPTFTLPRAPVSLVGGSIVVVHAPISKTTTAHIQAVGEHFTSFLRRKQDNSTESEDYEKHVLPRVMARTRLDDKSSTTETLTLDEVTEDLLKLDPAEWKNQDHYRVLGLSELRFRATPTQIKRAHQLRALQFHPDKLAMASDGTRSDAFFKCIQKAYDILRDPTKRRQYDSVDRAISDDIPKARLSPDQEFFAVYGPVFERESRFSKRQPVPLLGALNTPRDDMEAFYRFWASFDSWRLFDYLDKVKEQTENREEKRWQEKKNKAERARLKKEDNKRVSDLVQQAMALDPRVEMYREQERQDKERKRLERESLARQADSERAAAEDLRARKQKQEAEEKSRLAAEEKRQREQKKQDERAAKRAVRTLIAEHEFMADPGALTSAMSTSRAAEVDILLENMTAAAISEFHQALLAKSPDRAQMLELATGAIRSAIDRTPAAAMGFTSFVRGAEVVQGVKQAQRDNSVRQHAKVQREWSAKELEMLTKAANKFPGGTVNRWDTIGKWLAQHGGFKLRSGDELLAKTSELRKGANSGSGSLVKELQNRMVSTTDNATLNQASVRYDGPALVPPQQTQQETPKEAVSERPWSAIEQGQLERALQAYPPSYKGADRWDKIAEAVVGRTRKECKSRVRHLAEQVRNKNAAN